MVRKFTALLFQSRYRAAFHFRLSALGTQPRAKRLGFNLVIERLFISGVSIVFVYDDPFFVSISLSSGFSFQGREKSQRTTYVDSFNLVIERLFISGISAASSRLAASPTVSISLSSGFSFQAAVAGTPADCLSHVSISLSSGFSFQDCTLTLTLGASPSFNLVIERLFISGRVPRPAA